MKYIFVLVLIIPFLAIASERHTTSSMSDVWTFAQMQSDKMKPESTLIVFDIDNTLIALDPDLGSDQWFTWQTGLIKANEKTNKLGRHQVAPNIEELFLLQFKFFAVFKTHPVEKNTAEIVNQFQNRKYSVIALTSRGPIYRSQTEMHLKNSNISFKTSSFGPAGGYASTFFPENISGAREISYMDGIAMGSGQNKGKVLSSLFAKTKTEFKSIIFVDDTLKNIENVEGELFKTVDLHTFYYTHEDSRVAAFNKDPSKAIKEWKAIKALIQP